MNKVKYQVLPILSFYFLNKKSHCATVDDINEKMNKLLERKFYNKRLSNYPNSINNTELLKYIVDKKTFSIYSNTKTIEGYDLDDIIQPGIDNPKSNICLIAPSSDAYRKFKNIYLKFIHNYYNISANQYEAESIPIVKSLIQNLDEFINKYVVEIDIQTHRNLNNYPFTPKIKRSTRNELSLEIKNKIISIEENIFDQKGEFKYFEYNEDFFNNKILKSAGVYRDWPDNRLLYFNDSLICLINEEDHLKFKLNTRGSNKPGKSLLNYYEIMESLEKDLIFAFDKDFGYLTTLPSNVGSGNYFKILIKLNDNVSNHNEIMNTLEKIKNDVNIKIFTEEGKNYLLLSNKTSFYNFANCLVELISIKDYLK